jgi:subtilisin family serine protease
MIRSKLARFALVSAALMLGCGDLETASKPSVGVVQAELATAFESADSLDVIISLNEPSSEDRQDRTRHRAAIAKLHDAVVKNLGSELTVSRRFQFTPALAGRMTKAALERIELDPNVRSVQLDHQGAGQFHEGAPALGADQVQSIYKLTGKGVRVAVLDTGIDTTHPDLSDAVVAQHCFTQNGCAPLNLNEGTSAEDDNGHGSGVAGIIASRGKVGPIGYAPGVEIVAVKVNDSKDTGRDSDWLAGLDWVYANLATLNVNIVNLSFGTTMLFGPECDLREPALTTAISNLVNAGVSVFASSGNNGSATMITIPACTTGVIAVGATYDSDLGMQPASGATYLAQLGNVFPNCSDKQTAQDQVTCFTNSSSRLDLLAPGASITSDTLKGATQTSYGTSQATPAAAGVAALMLECNPTLTPAQIKQALVSSGKRVVDPKNKLSFPVVRALAAVQLVCPDLDAGAAMPPLIADAGVIAAQDGAVPSVPIAITAASDVAAAVLSQRYVAGAISPALPEAGAAGSAQTRADAGPAMSSSASSDAAVTTDASVEKPASHPGCSCRAVGPTRAATRSVYLAALFGLAIVAARRSRARRQRTCPRSQ